MSAYTVGRDILHTFLLVLCFCSCKQPQEPSWTSFSFESPQRLEHAVFGEDKPYTNEEEARIFRQCPTISQVRAIPQSDHFMLVEMKGSGLSRVQTLRARLATGATVRVECQLAEGVLRCPVTKDDVELFLGFSTQGGLVACVGKSYSLVLKKGEIDRSL